jgi:predicted dehydrogenase
VWRIGILSGTGTARKRTIPALLNSSVCKVTVVHGRNPGQLNQTIGPVTDIRPAASEREFAELQRYYDVIYIASPPFLHLSHIALALQLGMPVICEKPLVAHRDLVGPILKLITESGVPFMLAHQIRHQQAITDIAEIIKSSRLGIPVAVNLQWCFMMNHEAPSAQWKLDPRLGGSNAMFDCGVHAIDIAVYLFGRPVHVAAAGHHLRSSDTLDSVVAVLRYEKFSVTITASQSGSPAANDLKITFPQCVLQANEILGEKASESIEIVGNFGSEKLTYEPTNLYRAEVEDFCQSLGSRVIPGATVADAAACSDILFAIEDAIETGNSTKISFRSMPH